MTRCILHKGVFLIAELFDCGVATVMSKVKQQQQQQ